MANIINLNAEIGADYGADDAQPAVHFYNTGSGPGLRVSGLVATSTASIDVLNTTAIRSASATAGVAITQTVVGNQTIGILKIVGNSVASGAAIEFSNKAFISITSTVLTTVANTDYAVAVQVGLETRYIPLYKAAALIGAAAF